MSFKDFTQPDDSPRIRDYGSPRLIVELTNICNLHCTYCLRDEDALYHTPAEFVPADVFNRILAEAQHAIGLTHVMFTGGEPALHPQFDEVIKAVGAHGLKCSFVTNGWHFDRLWPVVNANRETITHVAFSLDGPTRELHDRWRGAGSFVRLVSAFSRCRMGDLPFIIKTTIRKDTLPLLEPMTLFAARMGAAGMSFGHLLPTSESVDEMALSFDERVAAEQEIALLARIFRMKVSLDVGYYNLDPAAPCSILAGTSCNIDYRGRLSLCCNLSGYRGAASDQDIVADLNCEPFGPAFERLQLLVKEQNARRRAVLAQHAAQGTQPDLFAGSPCLFCVASFEKTPWRTQLSSSRALPVIQDVT